MGPGILEASFLPEHFHASAILNEPLAFQRLRSLSVVLQRQWTIVDLNLPTSLDCLAFGLSNANLTLLDILMCVELLMILGELKLIFIL
jgi:hypothetical protein